MEPRIAEIVYAVASQVQPAVRARGQALRARTTSAVLWGATTRYYLSTDCLKGPGDILLTGSRPVGALESGRTSTGAATVTVRAGTTPRTYVVFACADDANVVKEIDESNNCRLARSPSRRDTATGAVARRLRDQGRRPRAQCLAARADGGLT